VGAGSSQSPARGTEYSLVIITPKRVWLLSCDDINTTTVLGEALGVRVQRSKVLADDWFRCFSSATKGWKRYFVVLLSNGDLLRFPDATLRSLVDRTRLQETIISIEDRGASSVRISIAQRGKSKVLSLEIDREECQATIEEWQHHLTGLASASSSTKLGRVRQRASPTASDIEGADLDDNAVDVLRRCSVDDGAPLPSSQEIRRAVTAGVPDALRGSVWKFLCRAQMKRKSNPDAYYGFVRRATTSIDPLIAARLEQLRRDCDTPYFRTLSQCGAWRSEGAMHGAGAAGCTAGAAGSGRGECGTEGNKVESKGDGNGGSGVAVVCESSGRSLIKAAVSEGSGDNWGGWSSRSLDVDDGGGNGESDDGDSDDGGGDDGKAAGGAPQTSHPRAGSREGEEKSRAATSASAATAHALQAARAVNILAAYSCKNPYVGYVQPLHLFAALLLRHLDEEDAFWMLVCVLEDVVPGYMGSATIEPQVDAQVFTHLVKLRFPPLAVRLRDLGVPLDRLATGWFLTLFTCLQDSSPYAVARVWDRLLLAGRDHEGRTVLMKVGLAILESSELELMSCNSREECEMVLHIAVCGAPTDDTPDTEEGEGGAHAAAARESGSRADGVVLPPRIHAPAGDRARVRARALESNFLPLHVGDGAMRSIQMPEPQLLKGIEKTMWMMLIEEIMTIRRAVTDVSGDAV
jgi:hypothetical protein